VNDVTTYLYPLPISSVIWLDGSCVVVDDDGASVADDTETGEGGPCTGDSGIGWPLCRKF
jgi:hypothetical protein